MVRVVRAACVALTIGAAFLVAHSFRGHLPTQAFAAARAEIPIVVLYDQTSDPGTLNIISQDFETANNVYDSQAADDFVVPPGKMWKVQQVFVDGEYSEGGGPAPSVNVTFYADRNLKPSYVPLTPECAYASLTIATDAAGNFTIDLPTPCLLGAGTHWISVQTVQNSVTNGRWFWHNRATQSNSGATWRNQANGFATGCVLWDRRTICFPANEPSAPDQVFRLSGTQSVMPCGAWRFRTDIARFGVAGAADGKSFYTAGGYDLEFEYPTSEFKRHDVGSPFFDDTPLAHLPDVTADASAVFAPINNRLYIFGGSHDPGTGANTWIYDVTGNSWSSGAAMPAPRNSMASGYYNGKIYLVGGSYESTAALWEYDPMANTWNTARAPMPSTLSGSGFGIIHGHLLIAGGRDATSTTRDTFYDYDIATNSWSIGPSLPVAVWKPGSAVSDGRLWLFGGGLAGNPTTESRIAQVYDPRTDTWEMAPPLSIPRRSIAGGAAGNALVAYGGYVTAGAYVSYVETSSCAGTLDTNGDGNTERTVFRPSTGVWYSSLSGAGATATQWGIPGDVDVAGDYDGDGVMDLAVFRPGSGTWYIVQSIDGGIRAEAWGAADDIPLTADVDGDRKSDLVVYRPSSGTWFFNKSAGGTSALGWGTATDRPLLGDFDDDGRADAVVFRPDTGIWYIALATGGTSVIAWGTSGDVPVAGDWDGDGRSDAAIFRPDTGQWFVAKSSGGSIDRWWGAAGDVPVSGDYDGDGKTDFTVWRPGTGVWFTQYAVGGAASAAWGDSGDKPAGRAPGS